MKVRAVVCDVYSTILQVGPAPANADALWQRLFAELLDQPPLLSRTEFSVRTSQIVARQHAAAKVRGIPWPEILWPAIVLEVIPELARRGPSQRDEFIYRQMQIGRTLRLAGGAAECLRWLNGDHRALGIASNSQAYTLRELDAALRGEGLNLSVFDPDLRFWSFEHGFSKPDPHVFRSLTARLEARGLRPPEILMVGDRLDNDVAPARVFGWQTWQLAARGDGVISGNWRDLLAWLQARGGGGRHSPNS